MRSDGAIHQLMSQHLQIEIIETGDGIFTAFFSERGLARLHFPGGPGVRQFESREPMLEQRAWLRATELALNRALAGGEPGALPPLDLSAGTGFQQSVWKALREIPPGTTRSYGEVAQAIGRPGAVRAVGQACGANPVPVLVPCHRVLAAHGKLGGFSGGLDWKRRLLAREDVEFRESTPLLAGMQSVCDEPGSFKGHDRRPATLKNC